MRGKIALVLLLAGCSSGVKVLRWVGPPKLDAGAPGKVFVEVTGSESAIELFRSHLESTLKKELHFTLATEKAEGVPVMSWQVERWYDSNLQPPQPGQRPAVAVTEHLSAAMNMVTANGTKLSASYAATQSDFPREGTGGPRDALAAMNARAVLKQLVDDFSPDSTVVTLQFDEDPATLPGIKLARSGDLLDAELDWRALNTASAHYNIGVLLEARGAFDEAQVEYEAAAGLSAEPRYAQAVEAVKKSSAIVKRTQPPQAPQSP